MTQERRPAQPRRQVRTSAPRMRRTCHADSDLLTGACGMIPWQRHQPQACAAHANHRPDRQTPPEKEKPATACTVAGFCLRSSQTGPKRRLAETEGFEPSMQFLATYSLSRGAPSASRARLRRERDSSTTFLDLARNRVRITKKICAGSLFLRPWRRAPGPGRRPCAARARPVPCTCRR